MIRTSILALGTLAALSLTSGTASAQIFSTPPYNNYSYYPSTTVVTPVGGIVTTPVYSSYYTPRVIYPAAPVYRTGYGYRSGYGYRYGGYGYRGGYRGWRR